MPFHPAWLVVSLAIGICPAFAQEAYQTKDVSLFARLSYQDSAVVQENRERHVCVAVSRDGEYRILRSFGNGHVQRLHGRMPQEQLQKLETLLDSGDFRKLSGNPGGLIRRDSERFAAEIPRLGDNAQRMQWLNPDGENPFPKPIVKVIAWLKHFQPKNGKPFDYAEYPDVCPSGGLRMLQPSVAINQRP